MGRRRRGPRPPPESPLTAARRRCAAAKAEVAGSGLPAAVAGALRAAAAALGGPAAEEPAGAAAFWRRRLRAFRVLGLGSPDDGADACRHQLAFAQLVAELVGAAAPGQGEEGAEGEGEKAKPRPAFEAYDPAFTAADAALLEELGCAVIPDARREPQPAAGLTLYYMPHCEAGLYDALLARNWAPERLPDVVILGNSFAAYDDRWTMPSAMGAQVRPDRVLAAVPHLREVAVEAKGYRVVSAFNSLALHFFPEGDLPGAEDRGFWGLGLGGGGEDDDGGDGGDGGEGGEDEEDGDGA